MIRRRTEPSRQHAKVKPFITKLSDFSSKRDRSVYINSMAEVAYIPPTIVRSDFEGHRMIMGRSLKAHEVTHSVARVNAVGSDSITGTAEHSLSKNFRAPPARSCSCSHWRSEIMTTSTLVNSLPESPRGADSSDTSNFHSAVLSERSSAADAFFDVAFASSTCRLNSALFVFCQEEEVSRIKKSRRK